MNGMAASTPKSSHADDMRGGECRGCARFAHEPRRQGSRIGVARVQELQRDDGIVDERARPPDASHAAAAKEEAQLVAFGDDLSALYSIVRSPAREHFLGVMRLEEEAQGRVPIARHIDDFVDEPQAGQVCKPGHHSPLVERVPDAARQLPLPPAGR